MCCIRIAIDQFCVIFYENTILRGASFLQKFAKFICMLGLWILPLSTFLRFDFVIVPTVWYFLFLNFFLDKNILIASYNVLIAFICERMSDM